MSDTDLLIDKLFHTGHLEEDEYIEENLIKDLLRSIDMELLAEQMGSYFDGFLDHLPDNETDLYIMVESIGRALEGMIFE